MSFQQALAAELKGNTSVSAIVSTQVYLQAARPGASLPYAVIVMGGGDGHQGHFTGVANLAELTGDIECWEEDPAQADALADAVRGAVNGFRATNGTLGSGSYTANCRRLSLRAPISLYEGPTDGSNDRKYLASIPFRAWVQET